METRPRSARNRTRDARAQGILIGFAAAVVLIGIMRLLVWQQQQLFDLMERDFTSFAEAVMARAGG